MSSNEHLMAKILAEEDRRQRDALRVYRPQTYQEAFHRSTAHERIVIGGKRSGKSTAAACEFVSQVLGIPIIGQDGKPIPMKYPVAEPKKPRTYWVIGWDIKHIGQTLFRLLFEPGMRGAFNVIRDLKTQDWRVFNGTDPSDLAREKDSIASEPLIPERFIEGGFENGVSWENKKANVFESVTLRNGATIYAFPSSARNPKQGEAVSGIWIDEDIQNPAHVEEWQDRLTDTDGWLIWSAWPHVKNFALVEMIDRANEEEDEETPDIQKFQFVMSESNYIPMKAKKRSLKRMGDDDRVARRDRGELRLETTAMYDYSSNVHAIRPYEEGEMSPPDPNVFHVLRKILTKDNAFPLDWTRYLAIDPSHTRTAIMFGVVPPQSYDGVKLGDVLVVERELVMRKSSPELIAKALKDIVGGQKIEAFIMDKNAGRQTHASTDRSTFSAYSDQFKKVGLRSRTTQYSFIPGLNKPITRQAMVREMLGPRPDDALPSLYFVENNCYYTRKEFLTYQKKVITNNGMEQVLDEPANPRVHDAMACHDSETDVLTSNGWKRFSDIQAGETLATVNLPRNAIEYQAPAAIFKTAYSGEMVHLGGMKMDGMVTPNHRMVTYRRPRKAVYDDLEPQITFADDLSPYDCVKLAANWAGEKPSGPVLIPHVFNQTGLEKEIDAGLFAEFLGWYIAEGSSEKTPKCPGNGYRVNIAQKKLAGIVMLQPLLEQLPWKWTRHAEGFSCSSKQLWTYLHQLGNCYTKRVPEWIRWTDKETIRRFMVGAVAGDGNIQFGKRNYYTSSPKLADDVQELFLKLGVSASIHERHAQDGGMIRGRVIKSTRTNFRVLEKIRPIAYLGDRLNKPNFSRQHYEGNVYCAAVPNGTLITRRNGRTMVSGNSLEYLVGYVWDLMRNGSAWVDPDVYNHQGSAAYQYAQKWIQDQQRQDRKDYVHLGPGAAA